MIRCALILILVAATTVAPVANGADAGGTAVCQVDGDIAPATRAALQDRALSFVRAALGALPQTAYAMMAPEAQKRTTAQMFGARVRELSTSGPFDNLRTAHAYLISGVAPGSTQPRALCGSLADGNWVSVALQPGSEQAYVVVSGDTRNNQWAFTLWLVPDGDEWRVLNFHAGISAIAGRTPEDLLALVRREREAGRAFNAAIALAAARDLTNRGPTFQLGISQALQAEADQLTVPAELRGTPPFTWTMKGRSFTVAGAGMIGVGKEIGILFVLPHKTWTNDQEAAAANRAFIEAFRAAHPDYARAFDFLVARAMKPDNSPGPTTRYDNGKGFVAK
ncbi:MAG: hypothetical protein SF182_18945 [Deltaproteobacteria bacterium]|nr:hypothetical protein [Deltaproteobacteria bacterium]